MHVIPSAVLALAVATLVGCTSTDAPAPSADGSSQAPESAGTVTGLERPGAADCRALSSDALEEPTDDTPAVPCAGPHTAETFTVGEFTGRLATAAVDDERLSEEVLERCERRFRRYVGADASLALRTVLTWAWFRPSPDAWEAGARWYRCDLVASGAEGLIELRGRARRVLLGQPEDRWLLCAVGEQVGNATRVPCDQPHSWRAVTTVVLGDADAEWPGARRAELRTRDFCADSVGAWLGYPVDYAYGYTWLGRAEWEAGNRRSVCWARTNR